MIALFSMTAPMALAACCAVFGAVLTVHAAEWFVGFSMCVLALLKLRNIGSFSSMFPNYDLLAKRWVPYSYVYPFAEGGAGVLMIAGALTWLSASVALFIGGVGVQGCLHRQARAEMRVRRRGRQARRSSRARYVRREALND